MGREFDFTEIERLHAEYVLSLEQSKNSSDRFFSAVDRVNAEGVSLNSIAVALNISPSGLFTGLKRFRNRRK